MAAFVMGFHPYHSMLLANMIMGHTEGFGCTAVFQYYLLNDGLVTSHSIAPVHLLGMDLVLSSTKRS